MAIEENFKAWEEKKVDRLIDVLLKPLTTNVPHHIETSQLICSANQLTGFYIMGNTGR